MFRRVIRPVIAVVVLTATVVVFIVFFRNNPAALAQLKQVPLSTLGLIAALYLVFMATLIWIQRSTLLLCDIKLGKREGSLLMAYSSIINFFGPLQSGPGFRAAYLKAKHSISLKRYTLATFMYYGLYAGFSGLFIVGYIIGWWALLFVGLAVLTGLVALRSNRPIIRRIRQLRLRRLGDLALATLAQVFVTSIIYYVALLSVNPAISYWQAVAYTGAANFALFVSFTPGAIGFRESFLVFSQQIHGVSNADILTASLIDRSVYVVFLATLALIVFGMHAQDYLKVHRPEAAKKAKPFKDTSA